MECLVDREVDPGPTSLVGPLGPAEGFAVLTQLGQELGVEILYLGLPGLSPTSPSPYLSTIKKPASSAPKTSRSASRRHFAAMEISFLGLKVQKSMKMHSSRSGCPASFISDMEMGRVYNEEREDNHWTQVDSLAHDNLAQVWKMTSGDKHFQNFMRCAHYFCLLR